MRKKTKNISGRKRGGQPGNKNGLRHGFYSELFSTDDGTRLDKEINLLDDLKALRVKAFRLFQLTPLKKFNKQELMTFDRFLNAITSINTLERTRLLARGHGYFRLRRRMQEAVRRLSRLGIRREADKLGGAGDIIGRMA